MKRILLIVFLLSGIFVAIAAGIYFLRVHKQARDLILYGNVDVRLVDIGFRVSGQVDQLMFEEGDEVEAGSLMASLDRTPYDSQVRYNAAQLDAVTANLENAQILFARREELIDLGGVSREDLDDARANFKALEAQWLAAKASLQVAVDDLSYTEVYAPTDGVILTRIREPGTVVREGDPVYTLSVKSPVWIRAYVDEPNLGRVFFGMRAHIFTDVKNGPVYTGKVGFISPVAEFTPKTVQTTELRTDLVYRLRIYVDNPDGKLKQGMPVSVKLLPYEGRDE